MTNNKVGLVSSRSNLIPPPVVHAIVKTAKHIMFSLSSILILHKVISMIILEK
jgi:hypothetical protein